MPKVSPLQSRFNGGEFSGLLLGRVDSERYQTALAKCLNYVPIVQGPVVGRPGTRFVSEVKTNSKATRLIEFEFSDTQAYIIEFGDLYVRFYKDNAQILDGGPVEVVTPYTEVQLFDLKFTQSADVLYITHPSHEQSKLTRTSDIAWTLTEIDFLDGPYLPINTTSTTLSSGATSGSVTILASSTDGINGGDGFKITDIGRSLRMKDGSNQGWARITGFTNTTQVTAETVEDFTLNQTKEWRLGLWSDTTGFASTVVFHENRLFFAGTPDAPQRIDGSRSGDFENFEPSAISDGSVADDNAVSFTLNVSKVNVIRWIDSEEKGLIAGTVGAEFLITPSTRGEVITPTNINANPATHWGSANIQPIKLGKGIMFVQRARKKMREINFFFDVDGFRANDLTILADNIANTGIKELAYQKEPHSIAWCVRDDGVLAALTHEREAETLIAGWHRHILGGVSDAAGADARVESVAVIPSPDGSREEVWMIVQRFVDGAVVRQIEFMTKYFEDTDNIEDAFFVDSGLTFDDPKTITGITAATPPVVTSAAHGLSDGDIIIIKEVKGMTEVNNETFKVNNKTANTFELQTEAGVNIVGAGFNAYILGGKARKFITTVTGLGHSEGQTLAVLGDGAVQPSQVVTGGNLTLATRAATIHIGYGYNMDGQLLRTEAGAADGTALGKKRRIHRVSFLFHRSVGLKIGIDFDNLDPIIFRKTGDPMSRPVPLFTGLKEQNLKADYNTENQVAWRQDQPLPSNILAIMPQMATQDR